MEGNLWHRAFLKTISKKLANLEPLGCKLKGSDNKKLCCWNLSSIGKRGGMGGAGGVGVVQIKSGTFLCEQVSICMFGHDRYYAVFLFL